MVLEGIMLSKISQTEKDKHNMISFICGIQKKKEKKSQVQIYRKQIGGCQRQGVGVDESAKCVKMIQTSSN